MEVIENIIIKDVKKSQNQQMSYFSPHANFNCPYLKIGLWDLFSICWSASQLCCNQAASKEGQ